MGQSDSTLVSDATGGRTRGWHDASLPESIGRYRVDGILGSGAMGVVLSAHDPALNRSVAIKVLARRPSSRERARLLREAQTLARLSHPGIVTVHDVGDIDGRVFLAMERIDGDSLAELIADESLSTPRKRALLIEAAKGLAAAHAAGVVHGDFKPGNVMVGRDGRLRVVDFGMAQVDADEDPPAIAQQAAATSRANWSLDDSCTFSSGGTPAYMSPEQWRGHAADARSDQFSFCVTAWLTLTGRRPFGEGPASMLASKVLAGALEEPPPGALEPRVRRILERGLSVEPEHRWPSMAALVEALDSRPRGRVGAVAVALTIGVVAVPWGWEQLERAREQRATEVALASCREAEVPIGWGDEDTRRASTGLRATGLPFADDTADRVQGIVDGFVLRSAEVATELCVAELESTLSAELAAEGRLCLQQEAQGMETLVSTWADPTPSDVANAVSAASAHDPRRCADPTELRGRRQTASAPPELRPLFDRANVSLTPTNSLRAASSGLERTPTTDEQLVAAFHDARGRGAHEAALLVAIRGLSRSQTLGTPDSTEHWMRRADAAAASVRGDSSLRLMLDVTRVPFQVRRGTTDGVREYADIVARAEIRWGAEHPQVGRLWMNRGWVELRAGRRDAAARSFDRSIHILANALGSDHPDTWIVRLAKLRAGHPEPEEVIATYESALAVIERAHGPDALVTLQTRENLANEMLAADPQRGEAILTEVLAGWRRTELRGSAFEARTLANLAAAYRARGDFEAAVQALERSATILGEELRPDHPDVLQVLGIIVATRVLEGNLDRAEEELARLEFAVADRATPSSRALIDLSRARIEHRRGNLEVARALARRSAAEIPAIDDRELVEYIRGGVERIEAP